MIIVENEIRNIKSNHFGLFFYQLDEEQRVIQ